MRIVMLEPLGISQENMMALARPLKEQNHEFIAYDTKTEDTEELKKRAAGADILIIANNPLSGEVIDSIPNLKMISVAFTGIDHVDKEACKEKKVMICNAAGYSTYAVAELTYGLILGVLRNMASCNQATRAGKTREELIGNELFGKTMGIIGTGAIGTRVLEIGKAFGCNLLAYSRTEREEVKQLGVQYVSLDELMAQSDIISVHAPLTVDTKSMINGDKIGLIKPTSVFINTARGPIVDSEALAKALNEGKIAGAGIDVFETEPPLSINHPLLTAKNTMVAPHVAFATEESILRRAEITFQNIMAWLKEDPQNVML